MQLLRLPGTLNEEQWMEARRLTRLWYYWPLRLIGDAHAYGLLYAGIAGIGIALLYPAELRSREVLVGILASLLLGTGLLWLTKALRRQWVRRKLRRYNEQFVGGAINDDGVFFSFAGVTKIKKAPWSSFRSAIIGTELLILFLANRRNRVCIFRIDGIGPGSREELIATLRHNLGPHQIKEAPIRGSRLRPNVVRRP